MTICSTDWEILRSSLQEVPTLLYTPCVTEPSDSLKIPHLGHFKNCVHSLTIHPGFRIPNWMSLEVTTRWSGARRGRNGSSLVQFMERTEEPCLLLLSPSLRSQKAQGSFTQHPRTGQENGHRARKEAKRGLLALWGGQGPGPSRETQQKATGSSQMAKCCLSLTYAMCVFQVESCHSNSQGETEGGAPETPLLGEACIVFRPAAAPGQAEAWYRGWRSNQYLSQKQKNPAPPVLRMPPSLWHSDHCERFCLLREAAYYCRRNEKTKCQP